MRRLGILGVVGLMMVGCSPPDIVQMNPPGYVSRPTIVEEAEAVGEVKSRGEMLPPNVAPVAASGTATEQVTKDVMSGPSSKAIAPTRAPRE